MSACNVHFNTLWNIEGTSETNAHLDSLFRFTFSLHFPGTLLKHLDGLYYRHGQVH